MNQVTGRWQVGFSLALVTAVMWGVLPIALKILLDSMDAYTITWYRFLTAALLLFSFLLSRRRIPSLGQLNRSGWILMLVAIFGLTGNYVIFLIGLAKVTPETAQMVNQLAPMFLLLGGLTFFGESFRVKQWAGFVLLLVGLVLFFNGRMLSLSGATRDFYLGVSLIVVSAAIWSAYGLAQKRLLAALPSEEILLVLYAAAAFLLFPTAHLSQITQLDGVALLMLAFCCLNTVIAYGSFAEALAHWEASRVGAVLATTPLITLAVMWLTKDLTPASVMPEKLGAVAIVGACLAVAGSMLAALGSRRSQCQDLSSEAVRPESQN